MKKTNSVRIGVDLALVVASLTVPFWGLDNYTMDLVDLAFLYSIVIIGYSLVFGHVGQISFAAVPFFGIGSYTVAVLLTKTRWPLAADYVVAALIAAVVAASVGVFLFRLKGHYLAIATLAIAEMFQQIVSNLGITKGVLGITNIPSPSLYGHSFSSYSQMYWWIWPFLVASILVVRLLVNSRWGKTFHAVKGSEIATGSLGVNVVGIKVLAFVLSAIFAAIGGALFAQLAGYISPDSYGVDTIIQFLAMLIIGGQTSWVGAMIGAFLITFLPEWLRFLQGWYIIVYAIAIMFLIAIAPNGIAGQLGNGLERLRAMLSVSGRARRVH